MKTSRVRCTTRMEFSSAMFWQRVAPICTSFTLRGMLRILFEVASPVGERILKVEFQVEFLEVVHIVFAGDMCTCRSCVRDAGIGGAELQREGNA